MFDVLWTDPNRELLKERIVKKDQEAKAKGKSSKASQSTRRSMSTHSSSSSDRGFSLFMPRSRKAQGTPSKAEKPATPPELSTDVGVGDRRNSTYGVKSLLSHPDTSETTVKPSIGALPSIRHLEFGDAVSSVSSRDSILSKCTQPSAASTSTWASGTCVRDSIIGSKSEYMFQSLGPSSFITRTTDVTSSPRTPDIDIDHLISEVHISSQGEKAATPPASETPDEESTSWDSTQDSGPDVSAEMPMTIGDTEFLMPPSHSPRTPPSARNVKSPVVPSTGWQVDDRAINPEAWKPPHEWECTPTRRGRSAPPQDRLEVSPSGVGIDHYMSPDIVALQREVQMMAMASSELILANIKAGMGATSDTVIYKELEMTKKRWMLSALRKIGGYADLEHLNDLAKRESSSHSPRILALYETQGKPVTTHFRLEHVLTLAIASASYLAALYPLISLSHLSQTPISPNLFPNVQPILVPTISTSAAFRPLPPQVYSTVTCLSMPALFPSTEIPPFLRHINRCLVPGGSLHLTLIDPQPVSSSMGPLLRQWLFEKLLINLERMFRTTYPSRTFPEWLEAARLRGKGSTIGSIRVHAVPNHGTIPDRTDKSRSVTSELQTSVIRMLWQEVWGGFVRADRWWWDEEDIIQECIQCGTQWEYFYIVAVKD